MSRGFVSCGFGEIIMKHFDDVIQQFYGFHIDHILRFLVDYSLFNLFVTKFSCFFGQKIRFRVKIVCIKIFSTENFRLFFMKLSKNTLFNKNLID